jgi:PAS domain S-box-containing protein
VFDKWLEEHRAEIVDRYVALRLQRGDPRPEPALRQGAEFGIDVSIKSVLGEMDWEQATTAGARKVLETGGSLQALSETARSLFLAMRAVLEQHRPEQALEWLGIIGDYALCGSETVAKVMEENLKQRIAEREYSEQRLRDSQSMLRGMADYASTVIFVKDLEGKYLLVNKRYEELFNVTNEEIAGKTDFDIFPAEAAEQFRAKDRKALEAAGPIEEEEIVPHGDGQHTYISVKFPLLDADGRAFATCGIATDITERKRAEEVLARHHDELEQRAEEQEAIFHKFAEASRQGLGMADLDGKITYLNPAVCGFMGLAGMEQGIGRHISEFHPVEERERMAREVVPTVLEKGEWTGEMPLLHVSGEPVPMILSMFVIRDDKGKPQRFAAVLTDITERKRAEESLKVEQQRLMTLFDGLNEVVYVSDPKTYEILFANRFVREAFGKPLVGGICHKELQGLDEPCEFCTNAIILADKGEVYRWEYHNPVVGRDYLVNDKIIEWPDGREVRFELAIDITERKAAERALVESESKYRALFENSVVGQFRVAVGGKMLDANHAMAEMFGWDDLESFVNECEMAGLWVDPADRAQMYALMKEHGELDNFETRFYRKDGSTFPIRVSSKMYPEFGYQEGICVDVSEEKAALAALKESEQRYRTIFDTAGTGMISFGDDGVIILANEEWVKISGYSIEETVGKLTWMPFFTEQSLVKMRKYHEMRTKDPSSVPKAYEAQFVDRAGRVHEGIINIQMVPGTQQRVASFQDMTAVKQAQQQMYRADKMAALGQIIAGVAHEINNPNNFIYFNLPILRKYVEAVKPLLERCLGEDPGLTILNMPYELFLEDVFKLLENMEHGSKRITSIVSDLKNYVRSDEQKELKAEQVSQTVDRVMTLVGKQVRKMVKRFDVEVAEGLPAVKMNPGKIEQVLINMVINAGQAADKDDSWVKLSARPVADDPRWVELVIEDNGAGIPEENLEQIFEPFFTSKGRELGTGLGLSISHHIVEEHGGSISVQSTVGQRTVFTIRLPAAGDVPD